MNKYVAITTSISISNYGTKLQALAMCEIFRTKGYSPVILEFANTDRLNCFKRIKMEFGNFLKPIIWGRNYKYKFKFNKEYKNNESIKKDVLCRYKSIDKDDFLTPHYRFVGSSKSLKNFAKKYNLVVTGSDQVWHPIINKTHLWFFTLNFASKDTKRIAYAPSLGVDELSKEQGETFRNLLQNMDFISLREDSGVKAIQPLVDKPVSLVLDPTLLVGRSLWDKVIDENKVLQDEDYCLCYLLGTNQKHREICEIVAKKLNLKILNFAHFKAYNKGDESLSGEKLYDVSPTEFIGLIKNAKFVVTDSFHCSVFSMMYHVPFMTLLRFQKSDSLSTNTRIYSMLQQFGLGNRILDNEEKIDELLQAPIDFNDVEKILGQKREQSNTYLDKALQDEKA